MTSPITLVLLATLDTEQRRLLDEEFGEPFVVVEPDDDGTIFRQIEPLEPVGMLVVVTDRDTPAATVAELDRLGTRYRDAVLVPRDGQAPGRWRHRVHHRL